MDNVVPFRSRKVELPVNLTCEECGSEWWVAKVVISEGRVTGMHTAVICAECGEETTFLG